MKLNAQYTLRLESERKERWKKVHRATYPEHGLSFNLWVLMMVERGSKEEK